jgi:type IV secretory pathway TraG/TraD family ATPase VirD4
LPDAPGQRLDPRLLFLLDELHSPVNLPRWMADSAGFGIDVWPVVHDLGQLEEKYGLAG